VTVASFIGPQFSPSKLRTAMSKSSPALTLSSVVAQARNIFR